MPQKNNVTFLKEKIEIIITDKINTNQVQNLLKVL